MDILKGDKLILTKEYDKMKMIGATYEVANITDTSIVIRDSKTKIAVAALSINIIDEYFKKPEEVKGWTPWTRITNKYNEIIAFYRTNGKKVQVRTIDNIRSEASCYDDEFNLFFGIRLAYLRCRYKYLNKDEVFFRDGLKQIINEKKDICKTMEKMMKSLK